MLAGGADKLALTRALNLQMSRDPALGVSVNRHGMSRAEERERSAIAVRRFVELWREDESAEVRRAREFAFALAWPSAHGRVSNHLDLFLPTLRALASDEQQARWLPAAEAFRMLGCFACTELGHGSFVRGLETTATFIPASAGKPSCFEVHTPTATAQKCWIGTGAQLATHAAVFAQLVAPAARGPSERRSAAAASHGSGQLRRWGIVVLLVQLRDTTTGRLLPGVSTRDLGPKMGRNGLDNGLMAFSHVRVPRTSLLSRFTSVAPDGTVTPSPLAQLAYGALVDGRALMVAASRACLSIAVTVATRHAARRRQFPEPSPVASPTPAEASGQALAAAELDGADRRLIGVAATLAATTAGARWAPAQVPRGSAPLAALGTPPPGAGETAVLDYPLHLARLVPQLGLSLCLLPAAESVQRLCGQAAAATRHGRVDVLKRAHCVSAAAKAEATWLAKAGIEACRQACGGFGYSSLSGLPGLSDDFAVMPTWEGDNHLMALQGSRLLLQGAQLCMTGSAAEDLPEEVRFLAEEPAQAIDQEHPSDSPGSAAGARQAALFRQVLSAAAAAAAVSADSESPGGGAG
mmetsp:Transcript_22638/g.85775  ORF Transcript_22638/g.85775 Transcript_22638/m.85775 type:complete len:581 (-) Transcript_22638:18-1760(-)